MISDLLCISEFTTKLVAGIGGLVLAIVIAVVAIVVHNKRG